LNSVLRKSDEDLLKKFSAALGLEDETSSDYAKKIEDEVMLIGMEGFLQSLNPELLRRHCVELSLTKTGVKSDLVEKLMVHIFELEPLNDKKETHPTQEKAVDKEKEEAKPKENKKRKAEPKGKKTKKMRRKRLLMDRGLSDLQLPRRRLTKRQRKGQPKNKGKSLCPRERWQVPKRRKRRHYPRRK